MCPPCDNELKSEAIIEHLCASEFGKRVSPASLGRFGIPWFLLAHVPAEQSLPLHLLEAKVKLCFRPSVWEVTGQVFGDLMSELGL